MLFAGNGNEKAYGQTSKDRIPTLVVKWDAASPAGERLNVFASSGIRVFVEPSKTDETRVLVPYFKLGGLRFGQVFPGLGVQHNPLVLTGRKEAIIQIPLHKNATFNVFEAILEGSQPVSSASFYLQGAKVMGFSAYHMDVTARKSILVAEMNGGTLKVDAEGGEAKVSGSCNDLDAKLRAFNLSMQGVCSSGVVDLDEESVFLRKDWSGKIKYIETLLKPPAVI